MLLKDFTPSQDLRQWVRCFRICHFEFEGLETVPVKLYPPKPEVVLHFFLKDVWAIDSPDGRKEYQSVIILAGQRTYARFQYNGKDFLNFQIVFHPTTLVTLIGIPANELTDQLLDAHLLFRTWMGSRMEAAFEQLQYAETHQEMLELGEKFVRDLLRYKNARTHRLHPALDQMLICGGRLSPQWLAQDACLSLKQFNRKFLEVAGVTPKLYSRIIRFTKAFNYKNRYPELDWLSISLECGYYDYQHLSKDYYDFTGHTPVALHELEKKSPEYMLGLTPELYGSRHE